MASSLASAVNAFAFDVLKVLSQDNEENVFFSPLSIFTALNMAALGAKGKTSEELFKKLRCDKAASSYQELHKQVKEMLEGYSKDGLPYALYLANKLLLRKGEPLVAEYRDTLASHYKATADDINFQAEDALGTVNAWVKEQTRGTISTLLTEIPSGTSALLLNAIYFKGKWCNPFDPKNTEPGLFHSHGKKQSSDKVSFMFKRKLNCTLKCYEIGNEKIKQLELKYDGGICMCIIVPEALDGLDRVISSLEFPHEPKTGTFEIHHKADVWLPRWKFETKYELKKSLQKLGLNNCFSAGADFSGISGGGGLYISDVIHKAVIEVNEEGTVAAAATAVRMTRSLEVCFEFKVDRPFLFYLKDTKSDLILFMGAVRSL